MTTKRITTCLTMLFGSMIMASTAAHAQSWSSAGSVCAPSIDSAGLYTYNGATFEFSGGSTGQIKTRCAVVNPHDSGAPDWSSLVVGYVDPDGSGVDYQVDAQLIRVSKTTGVLGTIKTFDSSGFLSNTPTSHSVNFTHNFDFTNFAYFITLTVTRGDANANPGVWFMQLK